MRRLLVAGHKLNHVVDDSIAVEGCNLAVAIDPGGIVYYSGLREIAAYHHPSLSRNDVRTCVASHIVLHTLDI